MSRRKRKLEIDHVDLLDLSSDDNSTNHNKSNHNYPPKKRVKFDQSVNADSSNDKYNKYESSSIHFPKLSNFLKVRVGDNQDLKDICYKNDNNESNRNTKKQLWLFHFPPGFDGSSIHNLKISIPKYPKSGQRVESFRIDKRRYQIIEYDCSQNNIVNLFPVDHKLKLGQPFARHFHILPDLRPSPHTRKTNKFLEMKNIHHSEEDNDLLFNDANVDQELVNNETDTVEIETNDQMEQQESQHKETKKKKKKKKKKHKMVNTNAVEEDIITETVENTEKRKSKKKKKKRHRHKIQSESDSKNDSVTSEISVIEPETSKKKSKKKKKKSKKSKKSKKTSGNKND